MKQQTFYIDGHGCAKNQVDGEELVSYLQAAGYALVESASDADVIIVNSCGFIESAKKESLNAVFGWKANYANKKVVLAGCLAQRYAKDFKADLPEADGIIGNSELFRIVEAVKKTLAGERPVIAEPQSRTYTAIPTSSTTQSTQVTQLTQVTQDKSTEQKYASTSEVLGVQENSTVPEAQENSTVPERKHFFDFPATAHVKITEGCSNACSFCAIPLIRGWLRSRPTADVVNEIKKLLALGKKEIILVGQDLASYGRDLFRAGPDPDPSIIRTRKSLLPELLTAISALEGDFQLRVLYLFPDYFPREVVPIMQNDPRILPYFDIPFQHASAKVLKAMNRKGSAPLYLELIRYIRKALPQAVIRSTFLVGFPGETDDDIDILLNFQKEAKLEWLGVFTYSREEGTASYDYADRVPKKIATARKAKIEEAQIEITAQQLTRFVGSSTPVIVEEAFEVTQDDDEELSLGRAWMQCPDVDGLTVLRGRFPAGSIVQAKITKLNGIDFEAVPEITDV